MSAFIKLGRKTASAARNLIASYSGAPGFHVRELLAELDAALAPSTKASKFRTSQRKQKQNTKAEKAAETARIYGVVEKRAAGVCECGCGESFTELDPPQMDHFWGKGKIRQSAQNCWMLKTTHHRAKTAERPSRLEWLQKFYLHCVRQGFTREAVTVQLVAGAEEDRSALPFNPTRRSVETFPVLKPAEGGR